MFNATPHAIQRFTERFAGNLSMTRVQKRLEKIAAQAHYVRDVPGHAKLYVTKHIALIVKNRNILTVYPRSSRTSLQ
ncbi:hypothetical protein [Sulfobacillus thermosulfidooxidans]|uniref:hypothetical protein n=1 Tax=Sulfobacillus thermosulfidooxidans TaxID=28034 RepID=UPI0006B4D165|nr:hypothetical protein [Sulfobacillus thermosulfidooxidans]